MARKSSQQTTQPPTPAIEICPQCKEFVGRGYPDCAFCREVAEQPIKAAWQALLHAQSIATGTESEQKLVATVLGQSDEYWWSEVEAAMRLTPCPACGGPLGYGVRDCEECIWSSDMLWGKDVDVDPDGKIRRNEHALRVMLRGLGQSHRHSQASIEGWKLYLPFVLGGSHPGSTKSDIRCAQAIRAWINAGQGHELAHCQSVEEMYSITQRGRL